MAEVNGKAFMPEECPQREGLTEPFDEYDIHINVVDHGQGKQLEALASIHNDIHDRMTALISDVVSSDDPIADVYYMAQAREEDFKRFICSSVKACLGSRVIKGQLQCGAVNKEALKAELNKYHNEQV